MTAPTRLALVAGLAGATAAGLAGSALLAGWLDPGPGAPVLRSTLVVALAALTASVTWAVGTWLVLRPLRGLVDAARDLVAGATGGRLAGGASSARLPPLARAVADLAGTVATSRAEARQSDGERRAAEARLLGLVAGVSDAVIGVGEGQQVTLFNRAAERTFGYAARDVIGHPAESLFSPAGGAVGRSPVRALAEGAELTGRRRDGQAVPLEVGVSMRAAGAGFVLVLRDRSEGHRGEAALRESEARFRGAFEHSASGMALQRPDATLLRVNRALCEMLGYTEQELLGRTHRDLRHPDDPEPEDWYERELRSGSIRWYQREQRYLHQNGQVVWGLVSVSPVRGEAGGPTDFLVQVLDVTERKRAESLEAQLRQAQKIEAVGQLAAGVAHDFNNLLMVITGRSHILLHRLGAADPLRRHVELIQTTAQRAGALTQQLLAFSRRQVREPRVLDLGEVVTAMVPMLRRLIGEQIDLVAVPGPGLGRVKADPAQVEQVILNLVVNARDAMPRGGRVVIETVNSELDEAFVADHPGATAGLHVALAVRDTGVGMDAATQARLFEPFFTTKGVGKGTGLGLATVYGIVKQSEGYIDVESEPGKGSTFTVHLPRVEEAVVPGEGPAVPLGEAPRGSETILLVEDEEIVRDLTREILHQAGYTVLGARHGGHALVIGDRHEGPIHLLVTDVVMPELGGRLLADRLVRIRPGLRVIFMSGYTDDAIEPHGVLGAGTSLLRKPLTPEALLRTVRQVLDAPPHQPADQPAERAENA